MPQVKKPGTMTVSAQVPTPTYRRCRELITQSLTTDQESLNWSKVVTRALESYLNANEPTTNPQTKEA
jgi:hypothetical protein